MAVLATHDSFKRLINGEVDLIFSVPISEEQQKMADEAGVTKEPMRTAAPRVLKIFSFAYFHLPVKLLSRYNAIFTLSIVAKKQVFDLNGIR